jgi:hypothetical protein
VCVSECVKWVNSENSMWLSCLTKSYPESVHHTCFILRNTPHKFSVLRDRFKLCPNAVTFQRTAQLCVPLESCRSFDVEHMQIIRIKKFVHSLNCYCSYNMTTSTNRRSRMCTRSQRAGPVAETFPFVGWYRSFLQPNHSYVIKMARIGSS